MFAFIYWPAVRRPEFRSAVFGSQGSGAAVEQLQRREVILTVLLLLF